MLPLWCPWLFDVYLGVVECCVDFVYNPHMVIYCLVFLCRGIKERGLVNQPYLYSVVNGFIFMVCDP